MYHTGSFIKGQSLIYNLDPRLKLATTVFLSIFILQAKPFAVLMTGIALLCVALISGIRLRTIGQALKPLLYFIVLIFLVHILFDDGHKTTIFGVSIPLTGLQNGFFVIWRFLCLIEASVLLTMTTAPSQMIAAIKFFLQPLKLFRVPVDDIAVMIMLALRLMPIILIEKERIEIARKARGYNLYESGFVMRIKAFLSLTLRVMLSVFKRADELALAMDARNYQRGKRSSFVELKLTSADYLVVIVIGFLIVAFAFFNSQNF
jgi:energy-coupling factor transport system permease protein